MLSIYFVSSRLNKCRAEHLISASSSSLHLIKPHHSSSPTCSSQKSREYLWLFPVPTTASTSSVHVFNYIQRYIVNLPIFLHHLLPDIAFDFLLQHLTSPHKNHNSQSRFIKMYIRYVHFLLEVCHSLHSVLEINRDSLSCL